MQAPRARMETVPRIPCLVLAGTLCLPLADGQPVWVEQGPGPVGTAAWGLGYSEASGAVQGVAVDPSNANRVFVATASGGVWFSGNAMDPHPNWVPLTDQQVSLSMGCIAMSPLDSTYNTLFAGIAATTHGGLNNGVSYGPLAGILKTSDGGQTWRVLGGAVFTNNMVMKILPTPLGTVANQIVFAAVHQYAGGRGGLFRSADGGQSWVRLSGTGGLPDADVGWIVEDPDTPQRLFVNCSGDVLISGNTGTNWTLLSGPNSIPAGAAGTLAISPGADALGVHWVYATTTDGLYYSATLGQSWILLDKPAGTLSINDPVAVDPAGPNFAFMMSFVDGTGPTYWRVNAAAVPGSQLYQVSGANAGGTGPHTDSRDWVCSADRNVLFEADDGGIYRLRNALSMTPVWDSAIGNLRVTEFYAVAYDSVNHVVFGACQDNGDPNQTSTDGLAWGIDDDGADCTQAGADNQGIPGVSVRYHSETFGGLVRWYYPNATASSSNASCSTFVINNISIATIGQCEANLTGPAKSALKWQATWQVNSADGARLFLGTDYLYESYDRGDHFFSLGGIGADSQGNPIPLNPVGTVSAYAYGHPQNPDLLYVGTQSGRGHRLWLRAGGGGAPGALDAYQGAGGGDPFGIAMDPHDWRRVYVVDNGGRVWRSTDAGNTWANVTGNLGRLLSDPRAVVVIGRSATPGDVSIVLGGRGGTVFATDLPSPTSLIWDTLGALPNAIVSDMRYNQPDDVLVAGTYGRGAWKLSRAAKILRSACYAANCDPRVAWLDFSYAGTPSGCYDQPFNSLSPALAAVPAQGTLALKPGTTPATARITTPMTFQACGGPATIGR
jgi:photosystem II stability/assembly factor-like uncharacterized protein